LRWQPQHGISLGLPQNASHPSSYSYVIFTQNIISNLFELFFQQKNHIPTTEFPTLVHYYTGGMTIYQVTQISGYTKNAPLP
jgi:hypothetical protein